LVDRLREAPVEDSELRVGCARISEEGDAARGQTSMDDPPSGREAESARGRREELHRLRQRAWGQLEAHLLAADLLEARTREVALRHEGHPVAVAQGQGAGVERAADHRVETSERRMRRGRDEEA